MNLKERIQTIEKYQKELDIKQTDFVWALENLFLAISQLNETDIEYYFDNEICEHTDQKMNDIEEHISFLITRINVLKFKQSLNKKYPKKLV